MQLSNENEDEETDGDWWGPQHRRRLIYHGCGVREYHLPVKCDRAKEFKSPGDSKINIE
jgi:hypothetical protein